MPELRTLVRVVKAKPDTRRYPAKQGFKLPRMGLKKAKRLKAYERKPWTFSPGKLMKAYVLDASVVLTFLLGKNSSVGKNFVKILNQAKTGKIKLYSSYLLPLEVGNGLRYLLSDEKLAVEVLEKFLKLPIEFFVFSEAHDIKILNLSYQFDTSFYDTSYHFLAKLLKGIFLTTDKDYFERAKGFGSIEFL